MRRNKGYEGGGKGVKQKIREYIMEIKGQIRGMRRELRSLKEEIRGDSSYFVIVAASYASTGDSHCFHSPFFFLLHKNTIFTYIMPYINADADEYLPGMYEYVYVHTRLVRCIHI